MGLRVDYMAKTTAAGVIANRVPRWFVWAERPFFTKTGYNEDPIRNTMYGVGLQLLHGGAPAYALARINYLFTIRTGMSTITAYGEAAYLKPGHPRANW